MARLSLDLLQEAIVSLSDQVEAAWLAILLELLAHALENFLLVLSLLWVVEKHAVLLADELLEEIEDVRLSINA